MAFIPMASVIEIYKFLFTAEKEEIRKAEVEMWNQQVVVVEIQDHHKGVDRLMRKGSKIINRKLLLFR